jgi:tetratricopeptide (TPR) repeat protein
MANAVELLKQAEKLFKESKYEGVIRLLPDAVLKKLKKDGLYVLKARAYYFLDETDLCLKTAEKALLLNPKNAEAYNCIGVIFYEKNEYKKAIKEYEKAILCDPGLPYTYVNLGTSCYLLKQYKKAIGLYNKALKIAPQYSDAYNGLGDAYYALKQYEKAIDAYNEAIKINPTYSDPYYSLGIIYSELEKYEKAIDAYNEAIKIDPTSPASYNGLGFIYGEREEYEKAIDKYNDAIKIDPTYSDSYYNRASTYFSLRNYKDASLDLAKYIELTKNDPDYYTSVAQEQIIEIEKLINIEGYQSIRDLVDEIKALLLYKEDFVTHYTTITVAKALILDKTSKFRLSEAAYLNDTSEGKELFNFLSLSAPLTNDRNKIQKTFTKKPFIGSFVAESKHNDLTLWRMYGKEDREEAKGCSITIRREEFIDKLTESLEKDKKEDALKADGDFIFYRVAYKKKVDVDPFTIPSGTPKDEEELNKCMKKLDKKVKTFTSRRVNKGTNIQTLLELLNEIAYLFKSYDYQYEHEIRLVLKGTGFDHVVNKDFAPPKVYIELVNIMPVITTITLGPKVERAEEWVSAFYYGLSNESYSADIIKSDLPFK